MTNYEHSKLTLGRILKNARQELGFSQKDLCKLLVIPSEDEEFLTIDRYLLSKIENNRIDIRTSEYDWLIPRIAAIFALDVAWLEVIRQQTEVEPLDLENAVAVFPIYFNRKTYDL
ncbi:helix-turn-helix transcriptional regulator [Microcoleus sp. POL10_C6]|uniref:helix-turn-helix transcriptional regulator n=1 Tax=Microcoleus sp. POL10_C6 TaxID=2818852 RepID=UPI002FD45C32